MSGQGNGKDTPSAGTGGSPAKKRKAGDKTGTIGKALRSVYDDTLREQVPTDFLDLLGKLS